MHVTKHCTAEPQTLGLTATVTSPTRPAPNLTVPTKLPCIRKEGTHFHPFSLPGSPAPYISPFSCLSLSLPSYVIYTACSDCAQKQKPNTSTCPNLGMETESQDGHRRNYDCEITHFKSHPICDPEGPSIPMP